MKDVQVTIVDYGAGNLVNVAKAFAYLGYRPHVVSSSEEVLNASILILPGVGAAGDAMRVLSQKGLVEPIKEFIARGKPFLGVCLGLQLLLDRSEEDNTPCMGVIRGTVRRLPSGLKVPHMGWNQVQRTREHPFFQDVPEDAYFYFVHSYYADPEDRSLIAGETAYGISFCSVLIQGRLIATQFHPEKSSTAGLRLYDNFVKYSLAQESQVWR